LKQNTKKKLKTILPLLLGAFLIWLSLSKFTTEELNEIQNSFYNANYWWIGCSLCLAFLSHLCRAYRWKFMLNPLGYQTKLKNNIMAVFVAYLVNLGIPRAGEFSRAAIINQYEGIPFDKTFGTIVAERLADMLVYFFLIALAFFAQYDLIKNIIIAKIPHNPILIGFVVLVFPTGFYLLFISIQKSKYPVFIKVRTFLLGLVEGVKTIYSMEKKWSYLFYTFSIWTLYVLMLYVVVFAFPETSHLGLDAILICFIMGTFSFATTSGGIGAYPFVIQQALLLYAIPETVGASFGWIAWTSQTILIIVFGGLSFLLLPILNNTSHQS
jgi:glycosyltransferase 2 family protein